jgi:two-component system phosphate regulon response regulator PhoB
MHPGDQSFESVWPDVHTPIRLSPSGERPWLALRTISRKLRIGTSEIKLTPNELSFVRILRRHGGRAVSRTVACENLWGRSGGSYNRRLEVLVRRLREKLGAESELIQTVHGSGYRLRALGASSGWQVSSIEKRS